MLVLVLAFVPMQVIALLLLLITTHDTSCNAVHCSSTAVGLHGAVSSYASWTLTLVVGAGLCTVGMLQLVSLCCSSDHTQSSAILCSRKAACVAMCQ